MFLVWLKEVDVSIFTKILLLVTFRNKYIPALLGGNGQFAHSLLTIKIFLLEWNALAVQKKIVHKNKLMELSIQMSSLPGYLQAQDSTVMLG